MPPRPRRISILGRRCTGGWGGWAARARALAFKPIQFARASVHTIASDADPVAHTPRIASMRNRPPKTRPAREWRAQTTEQSAPYQTTTPTRVDEFWRGWRRARIISNPCSAGPVELRARWLLLTAYRAYTTPPPARDLIGRLLK